MYLYMFYILTFRVTILFATSIQASWKNTTRSSTYATDQNIVWSMCYTTTIDVLPEDGSVKSETRRRLMFLKIWL